MQGLGLKILNMKDKYLEGHSGWQPECNQDTFVANGRTVQSLIPGQDSTGS